MAYWKIPTMNLKMYTSPFTNQKIFQQLPMLVLGAGILFPKKINNNRGKIPQDQPPE